MIEKKVNLCIDFYSETGEKRPHPPTESSESDSVQGEDWTSSSDEGS